MLFPRNIRSLGANYDELDVLLQQQNLKPIFVVLTGTWLTDIANLNIFRQNDFKHIATNNKTKERGGGVAFLSWEEKVLKILKRTASKKSKFLRSPQSVTNKNCF